MKISDETKVGVLATVAITILILGYNFLKGNDLFSNQLKLYAQYKDIGGLHRSDPVLVNGMRVGKVSDMILQIENNNTVLVELSVNSELKIPKNSRAIISSSDLLGSKSIVFDFGDAKEYVKDKDTLFAHSEASFSQQVSAQIAPVKAKAENLLASLDTVLIIVESIFNPETRESIQHGVFNMKETLENINSTTAKFDEFMGNELKVTFGNIAVITHNFAQLNAHITNITENFSVISDSIANSQLTSAIANADKSLQELAFIMQKIERGEGTIGQLVKNDSLYNNLNSSTHNLSLILNELYYRPKHVIGPLGRGEKKLERRREKEEKQKQAANQ